MIPKIIFSFTSNKPFDQGIRSVKRHHDWVLLPAKNLVVNFTTALCALGLFKFNYKFLAAVAQNVVGNEFSCDKCGRRYKHRSSLKLHQRVECGKPPSFECHFCQRKFYHKQSYKYHLALIHKQMA